MARRSTTCRPRLLRLAAMTAAVALGLLTLAGCPGTLPSSGEEAIGANHPAVGKKMEVVRLQPLTGDAEPVSTKDIQGKVTLINFWGPWCGYCEVEFPHLVEMVNHFESNPDFQILSVSTEGPGGNRETLAEETKDFLARYKANFPTFTDDDQVTTSHLRLVAGLDDYGFGYPTTVILDRDGVIRGLWVGYLPGWEQQMRRVVDNELAKADAAAAPQK